MGTCPSVNDEVWPRRKWNKKLLLRRLFLHPVTGFFFLFSRTFFSISFTASGACCSSLEGRLTMVLWTWLVTFLRPQFFNVIFLVDSAGFDRWARWDVSILWLISIQPPQSGSFCISLVILMSLTWVTFPKYWNLVSQKSFITTLVKSVRISVKQFLILLIREPNSLKKSLNLLKSW